MEEKDHNEREFPFFAIILLVLGVIIMGNTRGGVTSPLMLVGAKGLAVYVFMPRV